jgi:dephospho-CoA kinase
VPRTDRSAVRRVALTGGIGSGKSAVAALLAAHGAYVIDADAVARDVVAPGSAGLAAVLERFGPSVRRDDGSLDRAALGRRVFADPGELAALEAITHPLIRAETARRAALVPDGAVLVHEIPLLAEGGGADAFDAVVVVEAGLATRLERLARDRGLSREEALARVAAQADDAERRRIATHVVVNDADLATLATRVDRLWAELAALSDPSPRLDP